MLRQADRPLSVADVAAAVDLHVNTARFHLDGLVEEGLAERSSEPRVTRGRPRILYASTGPAPGPRSYQLLAEMLTGLVSSLDERGLATGELGRAWGRHLIERVSPSQRLDAQEAIDRLTGLLEAVGFAPATRTTAEGVEVSMGHCPFGEVAKEHTEVVCTLHLGILQGALDELGAPMRAVSLEPFVTPQKCVARLERQAVL